jgi:hypothetical protein
VYVHLLIQAVNTDIVEVAVMELYVDTAGRETSILGLVGTGDLVIRTREEGGITLISCSARISSVSELRTILPCTIGVRLHVGDQFLETGAYMDLDDEGEPAELVPFSEDTMIVQPVASERFLEETNPYYAGGGRVCEMGLIMLGESGAGSLVLVDWAACRPAPKLNCTVACAELAGEVMVLPGGLGVLTGSHN